MNITKTPKTEAAKTEAGISTGMLITKHDAVAMDSRGKEKIVKAGSLISRAISSGFDGRLDSMSATYKLGTDGEEITFRA